MNYIRLYEYNWCYYKAISWEIKQKKKKKKKRFNVNGFMIIFIISVSGPLQFFFAESEDSK